MNLIEALKQGKAVRRKTARNPTMRDWVSSDFLINNLLYPRNAGGSIFGKASILSEVDFLADDWEHQIEPTLHLSKDHIKCECETCKRLG